MKDGESLEVVIRDVNYRRVYKAIVRANDKRGMKQLIEDLKHFGFDLISISNMFKRINVFGEVEN